MKKYQQEHYVAYARQYAHIVHDMKISKISDVVSKYHDIFDIFRYFDIFEKSRYFPTLTKILILVLGPKYLLRVFTNDHQTGYHT